MEIHSRSFSHDGPIPGSCTCDAEDRSPHLGWSGAPDGTRSFALFVDDPDAPGGTFSHWGLFDIPATVAELDEGRPDTAEARQATNDFERTGWGGPCPPPGHGLHHYHFRLLALDIEHLGVPQGAHCKDVERAAVSHVLARAELIGTYER